MCSCYLVLLIVAVCVIINCQEYKEIIQIPSSKYDIFSVELLNALISGDSSQIAQVFNITLETNQSKVLALAVGVAVADQDKSIDVQVRARAFKKNGDIKSLTQVISKVYQGQADEHDNVWGNLYIEKKSSKQTYEYGELVSVAYSEDQESVSFAYADTKAIDDLVIQVEQITDFAIQKLNDNQVDAIILAQDTAASIAIAIAVAIAKAYGYVDVKGQGGSAYAYSTTNTEAFAKAVSVAIIQKIYITSYHDSQDVLSVFAEAMGFLISRTSADASIQVFSQGGSFEEQVEAVKVAIAESVSRVLIKAFVNFQNNQISTNSEVETSVDQTSEKSEQIIGFDSSSIEIQNNCQALSEVFRALVNSGTDDWGLQNALQNLMDQCEDAILLKTYLPKDYQSLNLIRACPQSCKKGVCEKTVRKFDGVALCDHYRQLVLAQFKTQNFCACQIEFQDEMALYLANMEFAEECPDRCKKRICNNQKQQKEYSWRGTCGKEDGWRIWQSKSTLQRCSCKK